MAAVEGHGPPPRTNPPFPRWHHLTTDPKPPLVPDRHCHHDGFLVEERVRRRRGRDGV